MSDLIKREDAIRVLHKHFSSGFDCDRWWNSTTVLFALNSVPSADRPQGEWKPFDLTWGRSIYACSVCEEAIAVPCGWSDGKPIYDYCPMCGARMKGADDES